MKAQFKRDYGKSFMILEDECANETYEEKMIQHNRLRSLLVLQIMTSDQKRQFWYDITGCSSLKNYMDYEKFGFKEMESLIQHLIYAVDEAQEYLLDPGHILLSPEGIFFDRNTLIPSFAYFPFSDGSFPEAMRELVSQLLRSMTHEEPIFVSAMYELYEKILLDSFSLEDILKTLKARDPGDKGGLLAGSSLSEMKEMREMKEVKEIRETKETKEMKKPISKKEDDISVSYESDFDEFSFETPKKRKSSFLSMRRTPKAKEPSGDGKIAASRVRGRKKKDDSVFYFEEDLPTEESHETVLLSGSFLAAPSVLRYQGKHNQGDLEINKDDILIGSSPDKNDEVIKSAAISKHHARITRNKDMIFLEDLNSTNGTYVNGEALNYQEKRLLKKDDKIHFADEMFVLE